MKRYFLYLPLILVFAIASCKKESTEEPTPTLPVEQKNSVLIAKHTWTGCGPCGGWGFNNFDNLMQNYPEHVHIAFKRGNVGPYDNNEIFNFFRNTFGIPGATPTFHNNLNDGLSVSQAEQTMEGTGVIANANYEIIREGDKVKLNTTTKFFQDVEGTFALAPYLILDGLIANQAGHPDGANTEHHKVPVDIARPIGAANSDYHGYTIAEGSIKSGYTVNLECEVDVDASILTEDISFALMIFRNHGDGTYSLVNTFTK